MLKFGAVAAALAGCHFALWAGLFFVLFCVYRHVADSDAAELPVWFEPGRECLRVLMEPAYSADGFGLGCFGWLLNSALWGAGGAALITPLWAAGRRVFGCGRTRNSAHCAG